MKFRALLLAAALLAASPAFAVLKSAGGTGGGGGTGTVTSVGLTAPSVFSVSGSPVTVAGTIGVTFATGQTQNMVLASPNGSTGAVALRALVIADLPSIGANPTALVGLTAINGAASTALRSDSAPALDQSISPTWTGTHTFNVAVTGAATGAGNVSAFTSVSVAPSFGWNETDQGTDTKIWDAVVNGGVWSLRARNDALSVARNALVVTRTGNAVTQITYGNSTDNPQMTFNAASSGAGTGALNVVSTAPAISLNRSGAASDAKIWTLDAGNVNSLLYRVVNDAGTVGANYMAVTRSGVVLSDISFGNATNNNTFTFLGSGLTKFNGDVAVDAVGKGLQVKEGTNAKQGTCTLAAGTCTDSNTVVTANSRIFLTEQTLGTVAVPSALGISARTASTSFTILASAPTDTSVVAYEIFEPAP